MSTRIIKHKKDPIENLERILNKTTLVTQRLSHQQIMALGDKLLSASQTDDHEEREKALQDAINATEARATRELKAAMGRLKATKDQERKCALDKQKWYLDRLASRIAQQRNQAEEERMRELKNLMLQQQADALQEQWEECEMSKVKAVQEACNDLRQRLRKEFVEEKKEAVEEALGKAREVFKKREAEIVERTRIECQEEARREAARVSAFHQAEVDALNSRYGALERTYNSEVAHRQHVELDFRALQEDYRRFMDHTDGYFHSDYLMCLRHQGLRLAHKKIPSTVSPLTPSLPDT